jgi:Transposase
MEKKRFLETEIVSILHQHEAGKSVKDIAREHGISEATFYNWKKRRMPSSKGNRIVMGGRLPLFFCRTLRISTVFFISNKKLQI